MDAATGCSVSRPEMGDRFTSELERLGLWLRLGDAPVKCEIDAATRVCSVTTEKGVVETAASVLGAAGRSGNTSGLGLEALASRRQAREHRRQRALPDRGAAHLRGRRRGGISGSPQPAWSRAGAMCHAFSWLTRRAQSALPLWHLHHPRDQLRRSQRGGLKKKGVEYLAGRALMRENARARSSARRADSQAALLARQEAAGVHAMGPSATELIHIGVMALLQGATIDLFIDAVFNTRRIGAL